MSDFLDQSSQWLENQREKYLSRPILYQRGNLTLDVLATVGRTFFAIDDGGGGVLQTESRDYLIRAAHLILGGSLSLPQRGDQIHQTLDGKAVTYEVMAPGDEAHFRYSDPYRRILRIHCKLVEQAS